VALTFDDGWASAWTVAMPLLQQLGLKAILFAIPARISDAAAVRPTIASDAIADAGPPASPAFVTWPELRAMHASGVFDIQSHTRSHAKVFCDSGVTGFVTPGCAGDPLDQPLESANGAIHFVEPDALGTPLYQKRSRMSDARRFLPDDATAERCSRFVADHGLPAVGLDQRLGETPGRLRDEEVLGRSADVRPNHRPDRDVR
jgi:hypothetical protein